MKRTQIKELAETIAYYNKLSDKDADWLLKNLTRQELKLFIRLLTQSLKDRKVSAVFAGEITAADKKRISSLFPDKEIDFLRDDKNIGAGIRLEYGDFIMDYSVSGIVARIINGLKESL
jgi:F0F1-type ATP synthase, delta subunit (mitochondrial oligomycin sensitivity protein)